MRLSRRDAMFKAIRFKNFRLLRDATLPLGPFTLIVGPNASGKSSALAGLTAYFRQLSPIDPNLSVGRVDGSAPEVGFEYEFETEGHSYLAFAKHRPSGVHHEWALPDGQSGSVPDHIRVEIQKRLRSARVFSLDSSALAGASQLTPTAELDSTGRYLATVVDRLRDEAPERFERLNGDLAVWLPEFDRIVFETPQPGQRALALRRRNDKAKISAMFLSQGTLLAMALLTLSHLPEPPALIGLEEPDRGIHPRLLRDVRDALYRLAYPSPEDERDPVQVVVTTHSPYMLDLLRDHPEEIVIAQRTNGEATFERIAEREDLSELISGVHLGDLWYSGVLGGVPTGG